MNIADQFDLSEYRGIFKRKEQIDYFLDKMISSFKDRLVVLHSCFENNDFNGFTLFRHSIRPFLLQLNLNDFVTYLDRITINDWLEKVEFVIDKLEEIIAILKSELHN